ncbi:hypothetical protein FOB64_000235 [Candida albicans]|uniref:Uncharacterized protein n=1 Tax=Candida albicans TaxID=5476 RepID=A0A8H6F5I4_CANAX|nr:hypothetical protein FOB64_000235 [Candida albicans]
MSFSTYVIIIGCAIGSIYYYLKNLELAKLRDDHAKLASHIETIQRNLDSNRDKLQVVEKLNSELIAKSKASASIETRAIAEDKANQEKLKSQLKDITKKYNDLIEEKIKLESQFKEKQLSIISEHNDKIKELQLSKESYESEVKNKLEKTFDFKLNTAIEQVVAGRDLQIQQLTDELSELKKVLEQEITDHNESKVTNERKLLELQQLKDETEKKYDDQTILYDKLQLVNKLQLEENEQYIKDITAKEEEIESLQKKLKEMNADLTQVTKDLKDSKATIVEIENTTKDLKLSQELLHKHLSSEKDLKDELVAKVEKLEKDITSKQLILDEQDKKLSLIEQPLLVLEDYLEVLKETDDNFPHSLLDHEKDVSKSIDNDSDAIKEEEVTFDDDVFSKKSIKVLSLAHKYIDILRQKTVSKRQLIEQQNKDIEDYKQQLMKVNSNNVILGCEIISNLQILQQELEKKEDKDSKVNGKIEEIKSIVNSFTSPVAPNKVSKENITEKSPNAKTIVDETKDASTVKNQNNTTESSTDVISNTDYNDIDNSTTAETPFTESEKDTVSESLDTTTAPKTSTTNSDDDDAQLNDKKSIVSFGSFDEQIDEKTEESLRELKSLNRLSDKLEIKNSDTPNKSTNAAINDVQEKTKPEKVSTLLNDDDEQKVKTEVICCIDKGEPVKILDESLGETKEIRKDTAVKPSTTTKEVSKNDSIVEPKTIKFHTEVKGETKSDSTTEPKVKETPKDTKEEIKTDAIVEPKVAKPIDESKDDIKKISLVSNQKNCKDCTDTSTIAEQPPVKTEIVDSKKKEPEPLADDKTKASKDIKDVNKIEKKSGNKETTVDTKLETTLDKEVDTDSNIQEKKELFQIKEPVKDEKQIKEDLVKVETPSKDEEPAKIEVPSKDETPFKIQNIDSTTDNDKAKDEKDNVSKVDSNVDTKVVTKDDQDGIKKVEEEPVEKKDDDEGKKDNEKVTVHKDNEEEDKDKGVNEAKDKVQKDDEEEDIDKDIVIVNKRRKDKT